MKLKKLLTEAFEGMGGIVTPKVFGKGEGFRTSPQKQIKEGLVNCHGTWSKIPTESELEFWIQQYKIKTGHTEWSEKFQRNIWIEDD